MFHVETSNVVNLMTILEPRSVEPGTDRCRDLAAMKRAAVPDHAFAIQNVDGGPTIDVVVLGDVQTGRTSCSGSLHIRWYSL